MLRWSVLAGLSLALVSAASANAESAGADARSVLRAEPVLQHDPGPTQVDVAPTPSTPAPDLFAGAGPGIALSRQTYVEQDGSTVIRSGLVRSWDVSDGLRAGVGLFSVTHDDQKEPEFKRSWSAKNVGPRDRRVAAVGLNVSF